MVSIGSKSAAKPHLLLVEVYGESAASEKFCREWFRQFKTDDVSAEKKTFG